MKEIKTRREKTGKEKRTRRRTRKEKKKNIQGIKF